MSKRLWTWGRFAGSVAIIAILVWRLGTSPFLHGVRTVNAGALAAAAGIGVVTTLCCAWRWKIVAGGLGVELSLPAAVAAYYRSLFLNVTLPGGVVGDVHRALSHGRDVSDLGRALRAVAWERFAGQVVQGIFTVVVLLALASPVHSSMPWVAIGVVVAGVCLVPFVRAPRGGRIRSAVVGDLRHVMLARKAWPAIAFASTVVVLGHAITFLVAARTAGVSASLSTMLPLALLVMAVMVLPSIGGWGPREGATAWAFGAAGLGAGHGVATAVVYGVMVLVASLPGAAVLVVSWSRQARPAERSERAQLREGAAHA